VSSALRQPTASPEADRAQTEFPGQLLASAAVEPKGKGELSSNRVQNPHDPEATYAVKGQGQQKTPEFKERMKHRNGIEGTQSELVRGHGMRRARYRGLVKVRLQNYFIAAACNVKRWIRREAWKLAQAVSVNSVKMGETPAI